jgi:hypothetical protein
MAPRSPGANSRPRVASLHAGRPVRLNRAPPARVGDMAKLCGLPPENGPATMAKWRFFGLTGENHKKARLVAVVHYRKRSDSFQSRHKAGRVIGGWQWRAADRRCASRCGHSSRRASGLGVAFVGALCRRIDSKGVDPRSLNWKISSPGKARDRSSALTLDGPLPSLVWLIGALR